MQAVALAKLKVSCGHVSHGALPSLYALYAIAAWPARQALAQAAVPLGAAEHGEAACRYLSSPLPTYTVKPSPLTAGEERTSRAAW